VSNYGTIGANNFCTGIVAGVGSVWSNLGPDIMIGTSGNSNSLAVRSGGSLFNAGTVSIGNSPTASVNSVCLGGIGSSSTLVNSGSFNIGASAGCYSNRLTVTNAVLNCSTMNVGVTDATNNLLELKDGTIFVNFIRIRPTNSVLFTAGTLNTGGTTMDTLANNGRPLVVGDGTSTAYLELAAGGTGFHDFNTGGLVITNNAMLRGSGTLVGNVTVLGTWSPGFSVGAITTSNNLTFGNSAVVAYDLGTSSDFTEVKGNLTLNGTLHVSAAAGFGTGTYTLFTYTGTLSGSGLAIGSTPDSGLDYFVDTNTAGQVKLDVMPPPVASFSGSPTSGPFPLGVTFTDSSTGTITNRFWNFGDGHTTNTLTTSVAHTYNAAGTNTVSLTVFGMTNSSTSTQPDYIVVLKPPQLTVSPAGRNYGSLTIGLTNSLDFSVINTGDLTLSGTAASASPFSVTSGASYSLAPGQTQTVTVAFAPVSAGAFTGSVTFASDGGNSTNTVIGTGLTAGSISVTPASRDFGNVTTGTTAFVSFTVTNSGGTSVSNGTATVLGGGPFTITSGATFSVPGFGATNVTVQFAPVSEAAFTDSVAFASDNGGVATNTVIGTGTQWIMPAASFTATPTNGLTPLLVTFTDTSTGTITNRVWNFGDGTTTNTTVTSLSHTYSTVPSGDVNKDGKVLTSDSLLISQVMVGLRVTNSATFQANYTVRLIAEGPGGSSTNTRASFIGLCVFPNGDVNQNGTTTSADSLLISQVMVGLRSYIVTKSVPNSRSNDVPTAVTIYGIGFPTNTVTGVTIGPPVNLTLSNVVAVSREQITAIVPSGGGLGTGTVTVVATPSNSVSFFGKFICQ
jgi:PKD repeat protein